MKRIYIIGLFFLIKISPFWGQNRTYKDTILTLSEVVVQQSNLPKNQSHSTEEHLASYQNINLIHRGSYGSEPMLYHMTGERSVITIDGMHIWSACTDKMDPVTSYVELHNLSDMEIRSGQKGNLYGSTIAGSIDLKINKVKFSNKHQIQNTLHTSTTSNGFEKYFLGQSQFSSSHLGANISVSYRKSENYRDGNNEIIPYSQYEKRNWAIDLGGKITDKHLITSNIIYDQAYNIGYPSLAMDVAWAKAFIGAVTYKYFSDNEYFKSFESKWYYNTTQHRMDDSYRLPQDKLPIKMDMPGQTHTLGNVSKLYGQWGNFSQHIHLNAFRNVSTASMRMYYQTSGSMFAYTWPEVLTQKIDFSAIHRWKSTRHAIDWGANFGVQNNYVKSDIGYNLNQVFHQFDRSKNRFLFGGYLSYYFEPQYWNFSLSIGYGQRAPSVSEAYGFYLFNNSDGYDYIGNPNLKNENAWSGFLKINYQKKKWELGGEVSFFYIGNYIFGVPFGEVSWQMTPLGSQKRGLKMYKSLAYAHLLDFVINTKYALTDSVSWENQIGYAYGKDFEKNTLPLIRPVYYRTQVRFRQKNFSSEISLHGDLQQTQFSTAYGEDYTPAYTLLSGKINYNIVLSSLAFDCGISVENVFNRYYTTYASWNNVPMKGRNIKFSIRCDF